MANPIHSSASRRLAGEQANARIVLLVLVFFLLGLGGGAFWYYRTAKTATPGESVGKKTVALSEHTKAVLKRLESPVEIRFYSLLDPASLPDAIPACAGRVDQLLSLFQQESDGKINVIRFSEQSDTNAQAAAVDGIKPFNRDKGDVCYLGLTIAQHGQKELLPHLAPEWEPAVELDITRAILRLMEAKPAAKNPAAAAESNAAALADVKRALTNLDSVTVEEGTRLLREAAVTEFAAAADEMEIRIKEAQERSSQAQSSGSAAEQQAAVKHLQQVQLEQAGKLQEIAARLAARIAALEHLKKQ